jgi:transposase
LDVHKDSVTACLLVFNDKGEKETRRREFGTYWKQLQQLRWWLSACRVTHVAMESTGVYWKPVWNVLRGYFQLLLANPYFVKNIPSEKTDPKDAAWIADLLAHGLIRPSLVPPREIDELRDLTRYRVKLVGEHNRIHNRIHKVLEDANLKLDCVASDILGATGRAIVRAILAGQEHPDWLADKARGRLREKRAELRSALRGQITAHHRYMLGELLDDLETVERKRLKIEQELERRMEPYGEQIRRLMTIPGIDRITAWTIIAEMGVDMTVFPDADHAGSWSGVTPGNNESAGKRRSTRTRKGNRWLKRALCQCAWAASHKKNCYLAAYFFRKASRHGEKKATMATAHKILTIAYHVLRDGTVYQEKGGDYFDRLNPVRATRRLSQRLERLGFEVILKPRAETMPETPPPKRPRGRPRKTPISQASDSPAVT